MTIGHTRPVAAPPNPDPIFHHVKAGMSLIIKNTDGTWRMADLVNVIGSAKNPKIPKFFQVIYVDNHVTKWVNAALVSHIVPWV